MKAPDLLAAYEQMALIRAMEQRIGGLYRSGVIPGFVHTSIGQEACAVGALIHTRPTDIITSTHRGHGHTLAKGLDPTQMLAELMGKESGACRGRGGSMHVAAPSIGIFGANGIVGAGLPIAVGAAHACAARGEADVVVAFFGDGAIATGAFHEATNLAALWHLPIVFLCENNGYSEFSSTASQHPVTIAARAGAYGIPAVQADGNDVAAMADTMEEVLDRVRGGQGPVMVEAKTLRGAGHYEGDPAAYRDPEDAKALVRDDPLAVARRHLENAGKTPADLDAVLEHVHQVVERAEASAREASMPDPVSVMDYVYAPRRRKPVLQQSALSEGSASDDSPRPSSTSRIIRKALHDALEDDPRVFLAGIDVAGGNVYGVTRGLEETFGSRVLDTPISETAIMGLGVGAAMAGLRPVVELMYFDFIGVCLDQLLNQAAKLRFMTGGAAQVPLVVRTQFGSGRSSGSQHSQSLEALLAHIPGLSVVMPCTPADFYGLLRSSIEDENPVIFVENRNLYEVKGQLPGPSHRVPIGQARVARSGTDVTVVSWSRMVNEALEAADRLDEEGISVEVIDLRTIVPWDRESVLSSVRRTNRLVIAHEAVIDFGVGAEIAAVVGRDGFWSLDAPIERVGAAYSPAPFSPPLERAWRPSQAHIIQAVRRVTTC